MKRKEFGVAGEKLAKNYLESVGLNVVSNNYYSRYGEIDIICEDKNNRIFVEVKSRSSGAKSRLESITEKKQKKIINTMLKYEEINFSNKQPRFDVIEVIFDLHGIPAINHISNAF
ncbi:MAG: YraN family protein [Oscillospiraceae bacterium]|nr:YraN family protein [Oscillospiraceae bacterium]